MEGTDDEEDGRSGISIRAARPGFDVLRPEDASQSFQFTVDERQVRNEILGTTQIAGTALGALGGLQGIPGGLDADFFKGRILVRNLRARDLRKGLGLFQLNSGVFRSKILFRGRGIDFASTKALGNVAKGFGRLGIVIGLAFTASDLIFANSFNERIVLTSEFIGSVVFGAAFGAAGSAAAPGAGTLILGTAGAEVGRRLGRAFAEKLIIPALSQ